MNNTLKISLLRKARVKIESGEAHGTCYAIYIVQPAPLCPAKEEVKRDIREYLLGHNAMENYLRSITGWCGCQVGEAKAARLQMIDDILMLYELSNKEST
jgi:hypothetical protein